MFQVFAFLGLKRDKIFFLGALLVILLGIG